MSIGFFVLVYLRDSPQHCRTLHSPKHHSTIRFICKSSFPENFSRVLIFISKKTDFTGKNQRKNDSCNHPVMVALNTYPSTFHY